MDGAVKKWRADGKHLPPILRDFHDQKDLFKTMHEFTKVEDHEYAKAVDWITGQCYIIDIFLWFMARHGYTLQRSRTRLPFEDITDSIEYVRARHTTAFEALISEAKKE